ncbi:MAG: hypothetical protein MUO60_20220 [Clostridiaceae bacterium]|nr:hypothetical protein [Clostridiaceae bacterium]
MILIQFSDFFNEVCDINTAKLHISPLGWEHINFIGQYNFDDNCDYDLVNNMRPLKE